MRVIRAYVTDPLISSRDGEPKLVLEKYDTLRVDLDDGGRLDVQITEEGVRVQSLGVQVVVYPKVGNTVEIKEIPKED